MSTESLYPHRGPGQHNPPSLPYAGTSGWAGSEASRQRAEERDESGQTATLQARVLGYVGLGFTEGRTIEEVRRRFPNEHHGSLSGALTALHKAGKVARLTEQRGKCSIYVHPKYVEQRETATPSIRGRDRLRTAIESLIEEFWSEVDWSEGRSNYGDNAAWEAAARRLETVLKETR